MTDGSSKELERLQKRIIHQKMHRIWQVAQSGKLDDLNDEEKHLAHIILEHEEYNDHFSNAEDLGDYENDTDAAVDPFMHISIHTVVENQLEKKDPVEVCEFYDAMKERGASRHDIIHWIGLIIVPLIFHTMQQLKPFDNERYKNLLTKHKDTDPEILEALLEKEFED